MTLSRSAALADRDGRAGIDGTSIADGASSSAVLTGRPSTTLGCTKIVASAAPSQQFTGRDVTITRRTRRLTANGAVLAKSLVYLSLFVLVSVIALIYKYLLFAVTYVVAPVYPAEFDRDAVVDALNEIEKLSRLND